MKVKTGESVPAQAAAITTILTKEQSQISRQLSLKRPELHGGHKYCLVQMHRSILCHIPEWCVREPSAGERSHDPNKVNAMAQTAKLRMRTFVW